MATILASCAPTCNRPLAISTAPRRLLSRTRWRGPRPMRSPVARGERQGSRRRFTDAIRQREPGGPGSLSARGSHRPVRARIRAYGSSDQGFATCRHAPDGAAIRSCFVDTLVEFRSIRRVSQERFLDPTPRFPPWLRVGPVRQLRRYYQSATTSCRPSRRTSLPSFDGTSASTRSVRSPADECAAEVWIW